MTKGLLCARDAKPCCIGVSPGRLIKVTLLRESATEAGKEGAWRTSGKLWMKQSKDDVMSELLEAEVKVCDQNGSFVACSRVVIDNMKKMWRERFGF